jgi:hypothetical protein
MKKIYGIDWGNKENSIVTSGQDRFHVKFWDLNNHRMCNSAILTNSPAWRARSSTPFGEGVIIMPHRKDTPLSLRSAHDVANPVHTFAGHKGVPRESHGGIEGNCQLVTWSKDRHLKYRECADCGLLGLSLKLLYLAARIERSSLEERQEGYGS